MKTLTTDKLQMQIYVFKGHRVMFDIDLAALYGVTVKRLNEQVKRNQSRFPDDFMFRLTLDEAMNLKSQFATSSSWGGSRKNPSVFTEQGIAMLSGVLHSERAIQANIEIMRAFVALRHWVLSYEQLQRRLEEMEGRYDGHFKLVFKALRQVLKEEARPKTKIGSS